MLCEELVDFIQRNELGKYPIKFSSTQDVCSSLNSIDAEILIMDKDDTVIRVDINLVDQYKRDSLVPIYNITLARHGFDLGRISFYTAKKIEAGDLIPEIQQLFLMTDQHVEGLINWRQYYTNLDDIRENLIMLREPDRYLATDEEV